MLRLQLRSGSEDHVLLSSSVSLGSDEGNSFVIPAKSVSDFHAEITIDKGVPYLVDLMSSGGTFLNGERVSAPVALGGWDIVRLGEVELEVVDPATCRPGDWALKPQSDLLGGQFLPLGPVTCLGRGVECDLRIESTLLSRTHARLDLEGDVLRVTDLDSTNGTFVNGERIVEALLKPGDEVCFDEHCFIVEGPGDAAPAPSPGAVEQTELRGERLRRKP